MVVRADDTFETFLPQFAILFIDVLHGRSGTADIIRRVLEDIETRRIGLFFLVHRDEFIVDVIDGYTAQEDVQDIGISAEGHVDEGRNTDTLEDAVDGMAFFTVLHFMAQRKGQFVIIEGIEHPLIDGNDAANRFKGVQIRRGIGIDIVIALNQARRHEIALDIFQAVAVGFIIDDARLGLGIGQHLFLVIVVHLEQLLFCQDHRRGPVKQDLRRRSGRSHRCRCDTEG